MYMNNKNGRSFLDDVEERGYLGFMLCYLRTITGAEVWPKFYSGLRSILSKRYTETQDFDSVIDFACMSNLTVDQMMAVRIYFGLCAYRSHSLLDTGIVLNRFAASGDSDFNPCGYRLESVTELIGSAFKEVGSDLEFDKTIQEICLEYSSMKNAKTDAQAAECDSCSCDCGESAKECHETQSTSAEDVCSHCCETCDLVPSKGKKKSASKKKSGSKKSDSKKSSKK